MKAAVALALCCVLVSPVGAQNPAAVPAPAPSASTGERTPVITYETGVRGAYHPASVSAVDFRDSARIHDLIRAGNIYLSLQDAIALALENNLDIQLQRYGIGMAATDTTRALGGGMLRGVPLTANEAPTGVSGPGAPLINSAATGSTPQINGATSFSDAQFVQQAQDNLSVTGTFPFSTGPLIPQFDPAITGQFLAQHLTTPETSTLVTGTPSLISNMLNGNVGYAQGFSPGTQVTAGFLNSRTDNNSSRNLINPFINSGLSVTITQPLLRGFGKDLNRRFIRIAQNSEKVSASVFRYQASITVAGVIRLYTDLVSLTEDLRVKQDTLATAEHLVEDNRSKVEQGTLAPIELTRAQAQVAAARQDQINAEGFVRQQELILKDVITRNASSDAVVHAARIIPTDTLTVTDVPNQPSEELVKTALEFRPDFIAAQLQLTNAEITLKGSLNGIRPQLDLVASATNNGLAGAANPGFLSSSITTGGPGSLLGYGGGLGSALEQILRRDYPSYSIGLNLTLPIRNRVAQADLARDELQLRQTQVREKQLENQVRLEVEDALIALQRTRAAWEAAAETSKLQVQSLEIEQERFNNGLSTNFLIIQYQNFVAQARSSEVAALGAYVKARSRLDSVMGIVLRANNVSIGEAVQGKIS
ncbi:MAG: TolC family protein [Acidobacteriota bacterium]